LSKTQPIIANEKVQNRQCLRAICNDSPKYANAEKGRLLTTDQKVDGSTPSGCTIHKLFVAKYLHSMSDYKMKWKKSY